MRSMYLHNPRCATRAVCVVRSASVVTRVGFRHLQSRIGLRIYYISLSWYISLHPSSITRIENMNIPLSHIQQYLHREYISHNIICIQSSGSRLPPKVVSRHVCTADKPQTAASQWGAHHCLHSHPKRVAIFLSMQRSIIKVLQSIAAELGQTLFLFFLDANRTLPEDRRVGAFPKFTDLTSCDSHYLLVLDDTASGLGDKVLQ